MIILIICSGQLCPASESDAVNLYFLSDTLISYPSFPREPCRAWGSQELWPDSGDAQRMQRSYCQLSGMCASVINGHLAFCPENCLRGGGKWQSKTPLLMRGRVGICKVLSPKCLEKEMATHPVPLPRKSHGQRSLVGYSPWGHKESDTTKQRHFTSHTFFRV